MNMESNTDTSQYSQHRPHRSRRSGSSRNSRQKIWGLSLALLMLLAVLFISFVYGGLRIEELSTRASSVQEQLFLKDKEVEGRLPTVMKLVPDKVLAVNSDLIKNIVFTVVTQDGAKQYEYKLVVENPSHKIIIPKYRLLIFDKYGVQIGIDQVLHGEELAAGESRSYSSRVDFFMKGEPAYFHVSTTIPVGSGRMQGLLKDR